MFKYQDRYKLNQNFQIHTIKLSASPATLLIRVRADKLIVLSPIITRCTIAYFDSGGIAEPSKGIVLAPKMKIIKSFDELYITGDNSQLPTFYMTADKDFDIDMNFEYPTEVTELAAGNNLTSAYGIKNIYVESFGNVVITDINGSERTYNNVPAGTLIEVPAIQIRNISTSDVTLQEYDLTSIDIF